MAELYQSLLAEEKITADNPYNVSSPVTGPQFFGREAVIASLQQTLDSASTHTVLIFGPARSGKTSLLLELATRLPDEAYVPVYWGLREQADLSPQAAWRSLARAIAKKMSLPATKLPTDLDQFRTHFLPRVQKKAASLRLVLLLDDVDALLTGGDEALSFVQDLSQLLVEEPDLTFILSTGQKPQDLPLPLPLKSQAQVVELPFLAPLETFYLVTGLSKQTPVSFLFETVNQIWNLTTGHPYFVQFICHEIFDYALKEGKEKIDNAVLSEVLPLLIERSTPDLERFMEGLSGSALDVLAACAALFRQQPITPASIRAVFSQNQLDLPAQELAQVLNDLEQRAILNRLEQVTFSFSLPLLALWLVQRYPLQLPAETPSLPLAAPSRRPSKQLALIGGAVALLAIALLAVAWSVLGETPAAVTTPTTAAQLGPSRDIPTPELTATPTAGEIPDQTILPASDATLTPTSTQPATETPTSLPTPTAASTSPPTSTPSPTPMPSPTVTLPVTSTPLPTATPLPSLPTPTLTAPPTPTRSAPAGSFALLNPLALDQPSYGRTEFEWQWTGPVPPGTGFEVRVWREGEAQVGVHDAVADNQNGAVESLGENKYRLIVDITEAAGVQSTRGEYLWTVALVQISPTYADLSQQAPPARLRFEPKVEGGDGGGGGGGSGGGVGVN